MIDTRHYTAILSIPIYGHIVKIVVCNSIDAYCGKRKGARANKAAARVYDYCSIGIQESECHFLAVFEYDTANGRLANHEANHVAFRVLRDIGCKLTEESEEAYTYLSDYIYDKMKYHIKRAKKSRTKTIIKELINVTNKRKEVQPTEDRTAALEASCRSRSKSS